MHPGNTSFVAFVSRKTQGCATWTARLISIHQFQTFDDAEGPT